MILRGNHIKINLLIFLLFKWDMVNSKKELQKHWIKIL